MAGENDGLPGITIDRYANVLVIQLLSAGAEFQRANLIEALKHCFPEDCIYERSDVDVRKKEGLEPQQGLIHGELPAQPMEIEENGLRLLINVETGHKTGYYLDQRNNRRLVGQMAKGKKLLNCFCYTGGFGTYALAGGAKKVVNVDVSEAALEIAAQNVSLNGLDSSKITQLNADVFKQLRSYRDCDEQFDIIVLDPPKFVDSKASLNRASRGYKDINRLALQMLRPGGLLFTYSCSGLMPTSLFQKIVADAAIDAGRDVLFDIDWQGAQQIRNSPLGLYTLSIFILPPSISELHRRLVSRGQDDESTIAKRMQKSWDEISHWDGYDYVIVNDDLDATEDKLKTIIAAERLKRTQQPQLSDIARRLQAQFEDLK